MAVAQGAHAAMMAIRVCLLEDLADEKALQRDRLLIRAQRQFKRYGIRVGVS